MARVTSSSDRSKGRANRPVTSSRGRPNRQGVSNAQVSQGSNGRPQYPNRNNASNRVTSDRQRPSTGNARVTRGAGARPELPPAGGTSGNTDRARLQQGWARDRGARAQLGRTLETLTRGAARGLGLDRQSQAQERLNRSAQGTRGEGTRVVGPNGANPRPQPQLPPGRNAGSLPPGRQGGALANRPGGGALANRPGGGALANRGSSTLATRPSSTPVDGRLVGVNVAEVGRRPRLPGQQALPSGQRALPPGRQGSLPAGSQGGELANRPSSSNGAQGRLSGGRGSAGPLPGRPGTNRPALPEGASNSAQSTARSAAQNAGRPPAALPPGRPPAALPPGRQGGADRVTGSGGRIGASTIRGSAVGSLLAGFLSPAVQDLGRKAGQWVGRNVLLPMVDRYEDATPGTQSARERRRQIVREGGRQGPPVPERIRRGRPQQQAPSSRPSAASRYQGGNNGGGSGYQPSSQGSSAPSRPQNRPQGASSAPSATTTPASSQRPAAAPPSSQSGGSASTNWRENFNPGRGTSYTNNPLLINDPYLMGKMKEREAKLPAGPVSDGEQYGESLRIRKLKQEEEARKKKK